MRQNIMTKIDKVRAQWLRFPSSCHHFLLCRPCGSLERCRAIPFPVTRRQRLESILLRVRNCFPYTSCVFGNQLRFPNVIFVTCVIFNCGGSSSSTSAISPSTDISPSTAMFSDGSHGSLVLLNSSQLSLVPINGCCKTLDLYYSDVWMVLILVHDSRLFNCLIQQNRTKSASVCPANSNFHSTKHYASVLYYTHMFMWPEPLFVCAHGCSILHK